MSARGDAFAVIAKEAQRLSGVTLAQQFAGDPKRAQSLTFTAPHLTLDLSKQHIDAQTLDAMSAWARAAHFEERRAAMFSGVEINVTERRAVLHVALRTPKPPPEVAETRERMRTFARDLRGIDAIVHLGIGGSDLGPRLIYDALKPLRRRDIQVRFAANIDGADITDALEGLDPARTLVIICSKTFTTLETLSNAEAARAWLTNKTNLAAVTAAPDKANEWGVAENAIFPFWDWVGGRYSLWSAIGLTLEIALEPGTFERLLSGAADMDAHFRFAPFEQNAPALAAAVQAYNREARSRTSYALIPYAQRLRLLPAYLQQQEMESNGKSVDLEGNRLERASAMVTWGEAGTTGQHSFFQMLHQGADEIPVEFIVVESGAEGPAKHRVPLLANALAQARALMLGKTEDAAKADMIAKGTEAREAARLAPHRAFPGNRCSTLVGIDALTPEALGALIAFYEHRTFTQGVLAGINSFDQYGVELGKEMATALTPALEGKATPSDLDGSTAAWIERLR